MAGLQVAGPPPAGAMPPSRKKDARGRSGSSQRLSPARPSERLAGVSARPEWDPGPEAQSCRCPRCAGPGRGAPAVGGASGGPGWTPFTTKRVGVDRAYPLKPVCHRKSRRGHAGAAAASGDRGVSARLPGPGPRSPSQGLHPPAGSGPGRPGGPEWSPLQRLEAAGRSLAEEIRRGEALLREKLRKTEEGLRRLRKERRRAALAGAGGGGGRGRAAHRPGSSPESGSASEGACGGDGSHRLRSAAPCRLSPSAATERPVTGSRGAQGRPPPSGPARERGPEPPEEPGSARRWRSASESSPSAPPPSSGSSCSPALPELGECGHCGRSFLPRRLQRHAAICGRAQATKRKVFDSSRARAKGTELEQYLDWKRPAQAKTELPKSDWRQKHESFIRTLQQAREAQQAIAKSGDPSARPPFLPAENPDYVQCPHCSRHFAPKVAERHIPKCKTIRNRPPPPRKHHA